MSESDIAFRQDELLRYRHQFFGDNTVYLTLVTMHGLLVEQLQREYLNAQQQ